jgi:hypothetical protein
MKCVTIWLGLRELTWAAAILAAFAFSQESAEAKMVKELLGAHGQTFETLDDYLAYLKERGASDHPYYELQPDGRYLHVRGRGTMNDPHYFTRAQLLEKFGFED